MEKLNRWVAKHAWLVYILSIVLMFLLAIVATDGYDGLLVILVYPAMFAWSFVSARYVFSRGNVLLKKPMEILLQECDPHPFLEETQRQRNYPGNRNLKLWHILYEGMALREIGEFSQAYALLAAHGNELVPRTALVVQAQYYAEMAYLSAKLGDLQGMEFWHEKLLDAHSKTKTKRHKQFTESAVTSHLVMYHYARQEYSQSFQVLQNVPTGVPRSRVAVAMNQARIHLALEEMQKAKEKLEFVIQNGNKLYIVTEAKELLARINMEEQ